MKREDLIRIIQDTGHSPLGASAASRWMVCPGSVALTLDMPNTSSDAAREGTIAHELAETCLRDGVDANTVDGISEEMAMYVQQYVDYVRQTAGKNRIFVEQELDLSMIIPEGMGTADAVVIAGDELHIIDLKYGLNPVDAEENLQLQIYAIGALTKLQEKGIHIDHVHCHIHQPRAGGAKHWQTTPGDLKKFAKKVTRSADLCMSDDAPLNPDDKACHFCKAKATCPALYEKSMEVVGGDFDRVPTVAEMTDEQLRNVLDHKGLIEKWLKAVELQVQSKIESGHKFEGYKLVAGRSYRKWNDQAEEKLVSILGEDAYDKKLLGVGAVEKVLGKKHLEELGITHKPEGKPTLVHESDRRQAIGVVTDDFETLD